MEMKVIKIRQETASRLYNDYHFSHNRGKSVTKIKQNIANIASSSASVSRYARLS